MADSLPAHLKSQPVVRRWRVFSASNRERLSWLALPAVVATAFVLNAWGLDEQGYGNTYYAAAARSMTISWSNFFFGAFDPGGFITVDKPPFFLWVNALSARVFGYSTLSLMLPSAVAGAASVGLLWLIVRRYFSVFAATAAGLVLALTPIWVAVHRLNLPEPFFILALVGAVGAVLLSLAHARWWAWILTAGLLVGVAFNTKMLAAWIPAPALAVAIVAGAPGPWRELFRQCVPRLALFGAAALAFSFSWLVIVDSWPASSRPYIGGSSDNSVSDLALGYNGIGRLEGELGGPGAAPPAAGMAGRPATGSPPAGFPPGGAADGVRVGNFPTTSRGAGGIIAGSPGPFRMFDAANGGQIAWFLPFAAIGAALALWRFRGERLPRTAIVLWLGWSALTIGIFSYSQGIYHSYYTAAIAPSTAALTGIGSAAIADLVRRHPAWLLAGLALAGATLYTQLEVTATAPEFFGWLQPYAVIVVVLGVALLAGSARRLIPTSVAMATVMTGLLLVPAAWSIYESAHASLNTTLPQAGQRQGDAASSFGSSAFDSGTSELAAWLKTHHDGVARWDLVVASAQNASTLIARDSLSVMAVGGFLGRDPTLTVDEFAALVDSGEVRYVLASSFPGGTPGGRRVSADGRALPGGFLALTGAGRASITTVRAGAGEVFSAVQAACQPVGDTSLPPQYAGALYDCAGMAAAIGGK